MVIFNGVHRARGPNPTVDCVRQQKSVRTITPRADKGHACLARHRRPTRHLLLGPQARWPTHKILQRPTARMIFRLTLIRRQTSADCFALFGAFFMFSPILNISSRLLCLESKIVTSSRLFVSVERLPNTRPAGPPGPPVQTVRFRYDGRCCVLKTERTVATE